MISFVQEEFDLYTPRTQ